MIYVLFNGVDLHVGLRVVECGHAGFGGLIRNLDGEWLCGFYGYCGIATNLYDELLAILRGLKLVWIRKIPKVACYLQDAISAIKCPVIISHQYVAIIMEIQDLISSNWCISLDHTHRRKHVC
ncbi:hypothetical protein RIF29_30110 [Crotalaria pallida]|uniref:RNase H type-1 domain-containing protein n=1 Tax=Crotalaria pallida TaxID=3830 RepID=A0AAN9EG28_CROPI